MQKYLILVLGIISFFLNSCVDKHNSPSVSTSETDQVWVVGEGQVNGDLAFGLVTQNSKLLTVTIKNEGVSVVLGPVVVSGPFAVVYQNGCELVLPNKTCSVKIAFNPAEKTSGEYLGAINLGSYTGSISAVVGSVLSDESLQVTVNSMPVDNVLTFGNLNYKESVIKTLLVKNTGLTPVPVPVATTGSFSVVYNNCATLNPKNSCTVKVILSGAGKSGEVSGSIQIGASRNISVQAEVLGQIESQIQNSQIRYFLSASDYLEGSIVDLGTVNLYSKQTPNLLVKNTGTDSSPLLNLFSDKSVFNSCDNISLKANQTCRLQLNLPTAVKGVFSENILNQENQSLALQYKVLSPGDKLDCTNQLDHAALAQITWTGNEYSQCQIVTCGENYHLLNNSCLPNNQDCVAEHGGGQQVYAGNGWGACQLSYCDPNYQLDLNQCFPVSQSCLVDHGTGFQTYGSQGSYSACQGTSCESGWHIESAQCVNNLRLCEIMNGSGTQTWNDAWGSCNLVTCDGGFHPQGNSCAADIMACSVDHGSGTQTWNGSSYNACLANSCTGDYHVESGQCFSNTKSCDFTNGTGQQSWNGGGYDSCQYVSCNGGYTYEGGACINTRSCPITNGTGSQAWNGSSWGTCYIVSCTSPFFDRGDNLTCENITRSVWNQGGLGLAQGGSTTLGSLNLTQQSDRHLVIYRNGSTPVWASGITGSCNGTCRFDFQSDGNLVSRQDNPFILFFASGTSGQTGLTFTFKDECPYYLVVHNSQRKAIWTNRNIPTGYYPNQSCGAAP
jgi:hypothetical protein